MITINNKFNIGEEVYGIWNVPMQNTCDMCDGTGAIEYREKIVRCPQCKGVKVLINDKYKYWEVMPDKLKIYSIKATINKSDVNIRYKASGYNRNEDNLFEAIEDAQKRCDELNYIVE